MNMVNSLLRNIKSSYNEIIYNKINVTNSQDHELWDVYETNVNQEKSAIELNELAVKKIVGTQNLASPQSFSCAIGCMEV